MRNVHRSDLVVETVVRILGLATTRKRRQNPIAFNISNHALADEPAVDEELKNNSRTCGLRPTMSATATSQCRQRQI